MYMYVHVVHMDLHTWKPHAFKEPTSNKIFDLGMLASMHKSMCTHTCKHTCINAQLHEYEMYAACSIHFLHAHLA